MASKRAVAMRMEAAVNRLVASVEAFGGTVATPARTPSTPADWAALIDSVSDALEAVIPEGDRELPEDFPARATLSGAGYSIREAVEFASDKDLLAIDGIGPATLAEIRAYE